ncbi:MAG: class I SAM-dependent methyltransferase [bacterium]
MEEVRSMTERKENTVRRVRGGGTMSSGMEGADNYVRWIVDVFRPYFGENVLEIGTGFGNFRRHLPCRGRFVSVDIVPETIESARSADREGVYVLADVSCGGFGEKLAGELFDTVLCVNVLEHVEDEAKALGNMFEVLAPGGRLLLLVPAFGALYSEMDSLAGHFRRYTKGEVGRLLERFPCGIVKLEYFNPVGGAGWWLNRFARHADLDGALINRQIRFFDRVLVPVSRAVNPVTRGFFGQSVVCVAVRK